MTGLFLLPFTAGILSVLLAVAGLVRRKRSLAAWCFFAGMTVLGMESVFTGLRLRAFPFEQVVSWLRRETLVDSFLPVIWLCFSLTYSRSNYREFLTRWKIPLALAGLLPLGLALGFYDQLFRAIPSETSPEVWALQIGTIDERAECHPARFVRHDPDESGADVSSGRWHHALAHQVRSAGSCGDFWRASLRSNTGDSVPGIGNHSVERRVHCSLVRVRFPDNCLRSNPTRRDRRVSLAGRLAIFSDDSGRRRIPFDRRRSCPSGATVWRKRDFPVSGRGRSSGNDRTGRTASLRPARQRIHTVVVRHFSKAQHDSTRLWTMCSQQLSGVKDQAVVCTVAAKLISETFDVLSVTIWLVDEGDQRLIHPRLNDATSICFQWRSHLRDGISRRCPRAADPVVTVRSGYGNRRVGGGVSPAQSIDVHAERQQALCPIRHGRT